MRITPQRLLSWFCVSDLHYLKTKAGYALQPSMTRKPQLQSYTIQVWLYETFLVSASGGRGSLPSLPYHLPFLEKGLGTLALAV